jgi:hypothetical protein
MSLMGNNYGKSENSGDDDETTIDDQSLYATLG